MKNKLTEPSKPELQGPQQPEQFHSCAEEENTHFRGGPFKSSDKFIDANTLSDSEIQDLIFSHTRHLQ